MAFKKKTSFPESGIYRARESFLWQGTVLVSRGDTVEAGHALIRGRESLFEPFAPTFSASSVRPVVEPEAVAEALAEPEAG